MNALRPYDLRVEHRKAPLGIDISQPRLSWRLAADANDVGPAAYRVSVAPAADSARVWDTGWVDDASLADVPYAGPLEPRTRYVWSVQLRDTGGRETPPVASWFETGMLRPEEFAGAWIAVDQDFDSVDRDTDPPQDDDIPNTVRTIPPAAYLRREFALPSSVRSARIHATAHGIYTLRLNGARVGRDELTPGWTDYSQRLQYQTYDVTSLLRAGDNAVGILLADGWWSGYVGFDRRRQGNHYGVFPEAWLQLEIVHDDGRRETLTTDDGWRFATGTIQYTDILMGEAQDARHDLGAWSEPAYDDSAWGPVSTRTANFATFVGQVDEPVRVIEEIAAMTVTRDPEGRFLYDFGQNLVGRVRIDLGEVPQDAKVVLRHGETLEDGRLYTANLRTAEQRDVYISAGRDDNLFEPVFTFHGFRYLEVTGLEAAPELTSVVARVLSSDTPEAGMISTSSDDVNRLISNIRWGQRGNFVSLPTDCPQRDERLGWMGDAQVFLPTAALNADVQSFFTRWLADLRGAQTVEGSFTDVVPALHPFTSDGAPAWADAGVIIPWHLYRTYGDRRLLADSYESMHRWVDFVEQHNPSLVWTRRVGNNYGDWLQIDAITPRALLATAYFAHSAGLVAKAAGALGYDRDATRYAALAGRIAEVFREEFLDADGILKGDSQTGYLLALAFELVEASQRSRLGEHLARTIDEHEGLLTTGFVGVSLLCPVLSEIGRDDLAFALLETDRYPSWLYSVRQGATTIWERWDGWTEHAGFQSVEMNSFNHYSLGSVGEWLYRYVAGIDQAADSVAYEHLYMAPRIGGSLTTVDATYESPRGRIASSWRLDGHSFELDIEVPPGVGATVVVPGGSTLEVGSGRHHFTSTLPSPFDCAIDPDGTGTAISAQKA